MLARRPFASLTGRRARWPVPSPFVRCFCANPLVLTRSVTMLALTPRTLRSAQQASCLRSSVPRARHHAHALRSAPCYASCLDVVFLRTLRPCCPAPNVIALRGHHYASSVRPRSRHAVKRYVQCIFCSLCLAARCVVLCPAQSRPLHASLRKCRAFATPCQLTGTVLSTTQASFQAQCLTSSCCHTHCYKVRHMVACSRSCRHAGISYFCFKV